MNSSIRVPSGLLIPVALLVSAAYRSASDDPPAPATSSAYTWTRLHFHSGVNRGPSGLGVFLSGIARHGNTLIAVAPAQALRSTDNGATWNDLDDLRRALSITRTASGTFIAGKQGGEMAWSGDDGLTWTVAKPGYEGVPLALESLQDRTFAPLRGHVLRSADQGRTWTAAVTPRIALFGIGARSRVVLATGGAGLVLRSADFGDNWETRWLPATDVLYGLAWADDRTAVITGTDGTMLRSTDTGLSWQQVTVPTRAHLRAVAFADSANGLAVGTFGEALRTADGGRTWEREATGTRLHLLSVVADRDGFLVAGMRETILYARRAP